MVEQMDLDWSWWGKLEDMDKSGPDRDMTRRRQGGGEMETWRRSGQGGPGQGGGLGGGAGHGGGSGLGGGLGQGSELGGGLGQGGGLGGGAGHGGGSGLGGGLGQGSGLGGGVGHGGGSGLVGGFGQGGGLGGGSYSYGEGHSSHQFHTLPNCLYICSLKHCNPVKCHYRCVPKPTCLPSGGGGIWGRKGSGSTGNNELEITKPVSEKVESFEYKPES
ncbi:uncharacterized protein LOC143236133 [Tachypleus tridentatus]|uniref:uncharacterized protein LOC143236133 n=1 Tax=Tachypleus tridentatus TaxID=6853 RepID=UPI003FD5D383